MFSTLALRPGDTPCFLVPSIVNDDIEAALPLLGAPLFACAAPGTSAAAAAARPSARASRRLWAGAALHTQVERFCRAGENVLREWQRVYSTMTTTTTTGREGKRRPR